MTFHYNYRFPLHKPPGLWIINILQPMPQLPRYIVYHDLQRNVFSHARKILLIGGFCLAVCFWAYIAVTFRWLLFYAHEDLPIRPQKSNKNLMAMKKKMFCHLTWIHFGVTKAWTLRPVESCILLAELFLVASDVLDVMFLVMLIIILSFTRML